MKEKFAYIDRKRWKTKTTFYMPFEYFQQDKITLHKHVVHIAED